MAEHNPKTHNSEGWAYSPFGQPSDEQLEEQDRTEMEAAREQAIQTKLDAQASRSEYSWKLRQMRQRGSRY